MMDIGAVEQRANRRNQHNIIGSNQFPHSRFSFVGLTRPDALAALPGTFYCYSQG
jgi:hypothetical protein